MVLILVKFIGSHTTRPHEFALSKFKILKIIIITLDLSSSCKNACDKK
jgi:hypothetical protein